MLISEIKPGMIFKDNDPRRPNRYVKIVRVDIPYNSIYFQSSTNIDEWKNAPYHKSKKPKRFRIAKVSSGYFLVKNE